MKFSGIQCVLPLKGLCRNLCLQTRIFNIPSQNTCLHLLFGLEFAYHCHNYVLISSKYDRDCSLRFSTEFETTPTAKTQLMFFSFQICLGSTDSHTLVYFFCVVFYGVCTKWESYSNEFHSITSYQKQISLVCVPRVF